VGIRYEFDYNRGNPGYIKDLFIDNLTPEPSYEELEDDAVYGYYGIIKQGEVAEYSDTNKNFDPSSNRFMYSDDNFFQSGKHDVLHDYGVTLPGFIIEAMNGTNTVLLSRDVHFYVEPRTCMDITVTDWDKHGEHNAIDGFNTAYEKDYSGSCKQYKTSKILIFGREYQINATGEEWLEVAAPHTSDYIVGPESEDTVQKAHVFRPVTNLTLTENVLFPDSGPNKLDYNNITYKFEKTRAGMRRSPVEGYDDEVAYSGEKTKLSAYPEKVTVKAKLTQVYQYVSECAGRGTCDRETGICSCFTGYSHDNCDTQTPVC